MAAETRRGSRTSLALKCAVSAAIVVALADPWGQVPTRRLAITMVVDTSASMSRESLESARRLLDDLAAKGTSATLRLVTFAGKARVAPIPPNGTPLPPEAPQRGRSRQLPT